MNIFKNKSYLLFIFTLIFAPLAFGTVEDWSMAFMEALSFLALIFFLFRTLRQKDPYLYEVPGILPLSLFLAFILLQLLPLPAQLIKLLSPGTYDIYLRTIWSEGVGRWAPLTLNRKDTLLELFRVAAYAAFYVLTVQLLAKKELLKKTISVVVMLASLVALQAVLYLLLNNHKIFWLREVPSYMEPFGPYINRNHYAGFIGMIFPLALGLFLFYKPKVSYHPLAERLAALFNKRTINTYIILGFSTLLLAVSIFLSLSRGGILSLCISMIFFGVMFSFAKVSRRKTGFFIAMLFAVVLAVGWFGWDPILKRFGKLGFELNPHFSRLVFWQDTAKIVKEFPVAGTGLGTFAEVYPKYRSFPQEAVLEHAHNDYVEFASEVGVAGFLLLAWFLLSVLYSSFKIVPKRRELWSKLMFVSSVSGLIALVVHGVTDFNFRVGANGLYFFFLAGLAVSTTHTRLSEEVGATHLARTRRLLRPALVLATAVFVVNLLFGAGVIIGKIQFAFAKKFYEQKVIDKTDLPSLIKSVQTASLFDPLEADYHFVTGKVEERRGVHGDALIHYRKALNLSPANGQYHQGLAKLYSDLKQHDKAGRWFRSAIEFDGMNSERYREYAIWLFERERKEEALRIVKTALSLVPDKTGEFIAVMVLNNVSNHEMKAALPDRTLPYLQFADYLDKTGNLELEEDAYRNALGFLANEKSPQDFHVIKIGRFYAKQGRYEEALEVMRRGIGLLPESLQIRLMAASLYEKTGIGYRAQEEYRRALIIDPLNREARLKVDR